MSFRRALLAVFSTALLLGLAWGCSAADNSEGNSPAGGGSTGILEAGNDQQLINSEAGPGDSGHLGLSPLCVRPGDDAPCVPDSPISCGVFTPPIVPTDDASVSAEAGLGGEAGANGEGGSAGDAPSPVASSAGEGGMSGAGGASSETGTAGEAGAAGAAGAPPVTPPKYSCQVQRAPYGPFSACALAGQGAENAPCLTAGDCQAGLGCVGDKNSGLCLKYCCQDADDCEHGSYCAERPMRDSATNAVGTSGSAASLLIPVCVHAENCDLSEPYPCQKGSECACKSDTACLVVRSDGTTTCAIPGTGKVGEACPCAWGHVCSAATNECLELCYTRGSGTCGAGKCQSASELPDGWGVCIGVTPSPG